MSTQSIKPPFPLFCDRDGQPLEDGYIWIGVAGLPPIGNPVNVYWDAAQTLPAVQPIRTQGGYTPHCWTICTLVAVDQSQAMPLAMACS